jgi:tetratricopeptide (TPR) repeat protein
MPESEGRILHGKAEQAREKGDFTQALKQTDEAMLAYQAAGDKVGFAEVLSSRFLTLRHLYDKTNDRAFLILAKNTVLSSVQIARESGDNTALALPLFNLGKAQETLGELPDAVTSYKEAVEHMTANPPQRHNRPSVLADMKVHLATAEYKTGDKAALARAEEALHELEGTDEQKYEKDVWVSGGYMRLADMLRTEDSAKGAEALRKAKEIIDSNPDLTLRKGQWDKLAATFPSTN